jgi:hypothetical protein
MDAIEHTVEEECGREADDTCRARVAWEEFDRLLKLHEGEGRLRAFYLRRVADRRRFELRLEGLYGPRPDIDKKPRKTVSKNKAISEVEALREKHPDLTLIELCGKYLRKHSIEGMPEYTPEKLRNAVSQRIHTARKARQDRG